MSTMDTSSAAGDYRLEQYERDMAHDPVDIIERVFRLRRVARHAELAFRDRLDRKGWRRLQRDRVVAAVVRRASFGCDETVTWVKMGLSARGFKRVDGKALRILDESL